MGFEKCMESDIAILSEHKFQIYDETSYIYLMQNQDFSNSPFQLSNCTLEDELNKSAQGTGLAFIVMTEIFTQMPLAPIWSILFFLMLLSLGLGSQLGILEGIVGTLFDI